MSAAVPELELDDLAPLQAARALWQRDERDAAFEKFAAAVAQTPRNVRALLEYARALGLVYRIAEGETLLERVRSLAGVDERVLPPLVQTYNELYRPNLAIEVLETARNAGRLAPPLLAELAVLYERSNRVEAALAAIEECVQAAPLQPEPRLILARLLRRRKDVAACESLLHGLTSTAAPHPLVHVQAWTELCQLRDALGDYAGAWEAIERAKQLHRQFPQAEPMSRRAFALNETFRQLHEGLNAATFAAWRDDELTTDARCGNVSHLLGFPRTGTTLLEQCLGAHRQIVDSPERAVFTRDIFPAMHQLRGQQPLTPDVLLGISRERLIQQRKCYLDAIEAIQGEPLAGRVHLDKNPNHTSLIAGLYRLFPESRFIVALRDPRDVLVSNYLRHFPLTEFGAGLLTPGSVCAMYASDMNIWLRVREWLEGQWLEVKYEDTVADLSRQAQRAGAFLGLPWDPQALNYRQDMPHKLVNSPSHDAVREPIYKRAVARWKHYERPLGAYFERLTPYLRAFGYD